MTKPIPPWFRTATRTLGSDAWTLAAPPSRLGRAADRRGPIPQTALAPDSER
jgi:hypothetical protein